MAEIKKIGRDFDNRAKLYFRKYLGYIPASFLPDSRTVTLKKGKKQWAITQKLVDGSRRIEGRLFGKGTEDDPINIDINNEADIFIVFLAACYFALRNDRGFHLSFEDDRYEFTVRNNVVVIAAFRISKINDPYMRSYWEIENDLWRGKEVSADEKYYYEFVSNAPEQVFDSYVFDMLKPLTWLSTELKLDFDDDTENAEWLVTTFINFIHTTLNTSQ